MLAALNRFVWGVTILCQQCFVPYIGFVALTDPLAHRAAEILSQRVSAMQWSTGLRPALFIVYMVNPISLCRGLLPIWQHYGVAGPQLTRINYDSTLVPSRRVVWFANRQLIDAHSHVPTLHQFTCYNKGGKHSCSNTMWAHAWLLCCKRHSRRGTAAD
jgi:hypothetical protein